MNSDGGGPNPEFDIPQPIVQQVRQHQASAAKGHEVIGRLVMSGGQVIRYDPLTNYSKTRDSFLTQSGELNAGLAAGESPILVHSHPNRDDDLHPSKADLQKANGEWLGVPYAIFFRGMNRLGVFRLNTNRKKYETLGLFN